MIRPLHRVTAWLALGSLLTTGCHPTQPFYLSEDGDLSHYVGVATDIEYPDVEVDSDPALMSTLPPWTVENMDNLEYWDVSLEEVIRTTLENSKIIRTLGGRIGNAEGAVDTLLTRGSQARSVWNPAIQETAAGNTGVLSLNTVGLNGQGPEAALADFDAQFRLSSVWNQNDRPVNTQVPNIFQPVIQQDLGTFQAQLFKTNATGGTTTFTHNVVYDQNNSPTRAIPSDWAINFEAQITQPLLAGAGTEFNRIHGPTSPPGQLGNAFNLTNSRGVVLSRINVDIALTDFEIGYRDLLREVEEAYWRLYFDYRNVDAQRSGKVAAQQAWRDAQTRARGGIASSVEESQAREQLWLFQNQLTEAVHSLQRSDRRLRYLMGLESTDGRIIRPSDKPTYAKVEFDWNDVTAEALLRSPELRQQKWRIKASELQLVAAKNFLLPRLDGIAQYRFLGLGDDLISSNRSGNTGIIGRNAWENLTDGDFQEWQLGFQFSLPVGFRRELANVRHRQLALLRDKQLFREQEKELIQQVANEKADLDRHHLQASNNFERLQAAIAQVIATKAQYDAGTATLEPVLDAQRRQAEAEAAFHQSLVNYNIAISNMHAVKGSIWEYMGVYLAEGPWPDKAYYDAKGQARKRDAGHYMDYGMTQPHVISRGPVHFAPREAAAGFNGQMTYDGAISPETRSGQPTVVPEEIPAPPYPGMGQPTPAEARRPLGPIGRLTRSLSRTDVEEPVSHGQMGFAPSEQGFLASAGATNGRNAAFPPARQAPVQWGSLESPSRVGASRVAARPAGMVTRDELPANPAAGPNHRTAAVRAGAQR